MAGGSGSGRRGGCGHRLWLRDQRHGRRRRRIQHHDLGLPFLQKAELLDDLLVPLGHLRSELSDLRSECGLQRCDGSSQLQVNLFEHS